MAGKWDGKTCPVCGEGTLHDGSRATHTEYRGESFTADQPGAYCDKCDEGVVYDDQLLEGRWQEFRERVDTAQALELAAIRARLGLTQEQAAKISGGGHNAFSRYERGQAQPVIGVLNLFRLLDKYPSLVADLAPAAVVADLPIAMFADRAPTAVVADLPTVVVADLPTAVFADFASTAAAPALAQPLFNVGVAVEPFDIFWGTQSASFAGVSTAQVKGHVLALAHQQLAVCNSGSMVVMQDLQPNDWSSRLLSGAHSQRRASLIGSGNRGPLDA